jgi:hypothetical protein
VRALRVKLDEAAREQAQKLAEVRQESADRVNSVCRYAVNQQERAKEELADLNRRVDQQALTVRQLRAGLTAERRAAAAAQQHAVDMTKSRDEAAAAAAADHAVNLVKSKEQMRVALNLQDFRVQKLTAELQKAHNLVASAAAQQRALAAQYNTKLQAAADGYEAQLQEAALQLKQSAAAASSAVAAAFAAPALTLSQQPHAVPTLGDSGLLPEEHAHHSAAVLLRPPELSEQQLAALPQHVQRHHAAHVTAYSEQQAVVAEYNAQQLAEQEAAAAAIAEPLNSSRKHRRAAKKRAKRVRDQQQQQQQLLLQQQQRQQS